MVALQNYGPLNTCKDVQGRFYVDFISEKLYLSNYLQLLTKLNCTSELQDECSSRYANYTEFTDLMYDRHCDRESMISKCLNNVTLVGVGNTNSTWNELSQLQLNNLTFTQIKNHCVQILMYDAVLSKHNNSFGRFHEVRCLDIALCEKSWCGVSDEYKHLLSPQFCFNEQHEVECRQKYTFVYTFLGVSAFCMFSLNLMSIIVLNKHKPLRTIAGVFRTNLALSDFFSTMYFVQATILLQMIIFTPRQFRPEDRNLTETVDHFYATQGDFPPFYNETAGKILGHLHVVAPYQRILNLFGCMFLTFGAASIYAYLIASVDRLCAVAIPFKYKVYFTRTKAVIICTFMWVFLVGVTLWPIFDGGLVYFVHSNYVVYYHGDRELILDLFFYLPVFLCWAVSITTVIFIRRNKMRSSKRQRSGFELRTVAQQRQATIRAKQDKVVAKAAKTLLLMLMVYTISYLPYVAYQFYFITYGGYPEPPGFNRRLLNFYGGKESLLQLIFNVIYVYNNLWNFFIYQVRDQTFREGFIKLFKKN